MAFIYKITNDVNGKVYIGKTSSSLERRWKEHIGSIGKRDCKDRPLYRAMNKYGVEHFSIEAVEQCTNVNASERERYWISYYNSYHNGYNATYGGDGKPTANRAIIILLWLANKTKKFMNKVTGYDLTTISRILKESGIEVGATIKRGHEAQEKPVDMYDLDGNYIKTFPSAIKASKYLNSGKSLAAHISSVCKGTRKTAGGYKWNYSLSVNPIV